MLPTVFTYNKSSSAFTIQANMPAIDGQVRDEKWMNTAGGNKLLLMARNNDSLLFLKPEIK
jgi:hypothetical protein